MASAMTANQSSMAGPGRSLAPLVPAIAVLGLAMLLALLNPIVFVGGGTDQSQYLQAANCYAHHGFCVATNHWETRIPVVAPLGGVIAILGVSRFALALVPIAY